MRYFLKLYCTEIMNETDNLLDLILNFSPDFLL
jgi:hypothetical protein